MDLSERYCYNPILKWNPEVEDYFIKAYDADHFSRICKALTHPSSYSCIRVNTLQTTSDSIIQKLLIIVNGEGIEGCSQQSLVGNGNGASFTEKSSTKVSISKCPIPGLEYVIFVKGSGPHTINYDLAPGRPVKEVIVSRKCAEAVLRGAQVFVPGVMACSAHVEKGDRIAVSVAVEKRALDGGWAIPMTRGTVLQGLPSGNASFETNINVDSSAQFRTFLYEISCWNLEMFYVLMMCDVAKTVIGEKIQVKSPVLCLIGGLERFPVIGSPLFGSYV